MRRILTIPSSLKVALLYLVFGGLWILLSDRVLGALTDSAAAYERWQTFKGSAFVLASALVIAWLVRRESRLRRQSERKFSEILDLVPDPVVVSRVEDQVVVEANRAFAELLGRPAEAVVGRRLDDLGVRFAESDWRDYGRRIERDGFVDNLSMRVRLPDDRERTLLLSARRQEQRGEEYVFAATRDVTPLREARDRFEQQVRRIQGLRDIDMAITASLDVRVTMNVVLDQVTTHLGVDAAAVLLVNRATRTLEYAAGRGFRTPAIRSTRLGFGEGPAGRAAEQRETVRIEDLHEAPGALADEDFLEEGFRGYVAKPLVAKGQVNGVLEIFHRGTLDPSREWMDFLDTLAGQASIAIDNAELYQDLQRSHEELRSAYDKTIEGWARALDLRDRETHGHTRRVAIVSVALARELGVPDDQLVHVRRGALLHDIGKMGVPDDVLLKPGPLDEEEWEMMERHPELAYRLLSPVEFLRPALDIPRYHHEKWDGTGYPDGLEGREIPLHARIFAVADVWDALLSARPYREAWTEEEAFEYLREEAGSHFDPDVVDAFFSLDLDAISIPDRGAPETLPGVQTDLFGSDGATPEGGGG